MLRSADNIACSTARSERSRSMNRGVTRGGKTTVLRTGSTGSSSVSTRLLRRRGGERRGAVKVVLLHGVEDERGRGLGRQAGSRPPSFSWSGKERGNYLSSAVVPPERSMGFEPTA